MKSAPSLPAHSLLGASSAARWLKCPGSFRLSQTAPPSPASIYAATGTLAHKFIDGCLQKPISRMEYSSIGNAYTIEGHQIIVDEDMVDGVNSMVSYVQSVFPAYDMMSVETRVRLDSYFKLGFPVKLFGTADVILSSDRKLEIVDYKNGSGVILDPNDNPQTLYYAAGAVAELGLHYRVEKIKLTIVQPHARSVAKVRSATLDYVDLMMWVDEVLIPGVEACAAPDAPLVPGSWCRFCPVSFVCPALAAEANRMAKLEFDDSTPFLPERASEASERGKNRVKVDDPDELSQLLDVAQRARAWCDALDAFALDQLKRQVRVPNWSLVPTRPMRRWIDDHEAAITLNALGVEGIYHANLKSPAQVEKLVRKQVSAHAWDDDVSKFVESVSSGVKLQRDGSAPFEDFEP